MGGGSSPMQAPSASMTPRREPSSMGGGWNTSMPTVSGGGLYGTDMGMQGWQARQQPGWGGGTLAQGALSRPPGYMDQELGLGNISGTDMGMQGWQARQRPGRLYAPLGDLSNGLSGILGQLAAGGLAGRIRYR